VAQLQAPDAVDLDRRHAELGLRVPSLQGLKNETRRDLAVDLLTRSDKPVKQIARLAGFGNEKSFARAFKVWMGCSPSDYRVRRIE
jgi:AraC-like DNA-binding protein